GDRCYRRQRRCTVRVLPRYARSTATTGRPIGVLFEFYLVDPVTCETCVGSLDQPLTPVAADEVSLVDGRVTEVEGATILSPREVNSAYEEIEQIAVQVDENSAIRALGVNQAFQGTTVLRYRSEEHTSELQSRFDLV